MSVQVEIENKLRIGLEPEFLRVENESHQHNVPPASETHFKVVVVSPRFEGVRAVRRHQMVYEILAEELAGSVHALALHTFSPDEWQHEKKIHASPECLGG